MSLQFMTQYHRVLCTQNREICYVDCQVYPKYIKWLFAVNIRSFRFYPKPVLAKMGPDVQNTSDKIAIVLWGDWPWS